MVRTAMLRRIAAALSLLSVAVWLGGLLALGAVAAPIVFAVVPLPASADAMTRVFLRFDQIAMGCAAVLLGIEGVRAAFGASRGRTDRVRIVVAALAGALAVLEGTLVSPRIAALHQGGARLGVGPAGLDLARLHGLAEALGKGEVALLVALVALNVWTCVGRQAVVVEAQASGRATTSPAA